MNRWPFEILMNISFNYMKNKHENGHLHCFILFLKIKYFGYVISYLNLLHYTLYF